MSQLAHRLAHRSAGAGLLLREAAERFPGIEDAELGPLLERVGEARVVLLGDVWFDRTEAVTPMEGPTAPGLPETYPFGL